jgi:hypothetical protein
MPVNKDSERAEAVAHRHRILRVILFPLVIFDSKSGLSQ